MFSTTSAAPLTTSSLFGGATNKAPATTTSLFSTAPVTASNLFGGAPTTTSVPLFSAPATTASFFPTTSTAPLTASNLFGSAPIISSAAPLTTSSLFGVAPTTTSGSLSFSLAPATTASLFSTPTVPSTTSTLFGGAPNKPPATTASLFSAAPLTASTLFGGAPTTTTMPLFSAPATTASLFPTTSTAPLTTSNLFGGVPATSAPLFSAPATTASLFPTMSVAPITTSTLFGTPTTTSVPLSLSSAPATTASLFLAAPMTTTLFGGAPTTTSMPLTFSSAPATTATLATSLFGGTTSLASTTTSAPLFSTSVTTTTMTSTVGTVQPKVPNFRDLSTTLLRMRMDFEQQEKQFLDEVDDLNTFDVVLRKAQDKLIDVKKDVDELEQEKDRFCWEIDILGQQQEELEQIVKSFESQFNLPTQQDSTIIGGSQLFANSDSATPADVQRKNILQLQININAQLKLLDDEVGNLCGQISDLKRIAGLSSSTIAEDDQEKAEELENRLTSVDQIRQILRSQLESLIWVDKHSDALLERVQRATSDILTLQ
uniref:Nucleoporin NSP1-like C-terminal domain-containing protein n=1 Tax=Meloidogyne enterolobii TaxID=390850 RepID=A0A6V7XVB0_MELEN|nr:unnamed protein product [Meloidogyne enterolobii]